MRTRICFYLLLLTPLLVYWQTVFHEYAVQSDYTHLRIVAEEPGQLVKNYAAEGRPLYGAMLETAYTLVDEVSKLQWLRLGSVLLLTLLGLVLWRQFYQSGWNEVEAAGLGLGFVLLPSAQVMTGWASGWAQALTLMLALAGFSAIETEIERGGLKRWVALLGACLIYTAAGMIYPSKVFFALVPIAAVLLVRSKREVLSDQKWCMFHLGALLIGLAISYFAVRSMVSNNVFQDAGLNQLSQHSYTKLSWLFSNPMPKALALFAVNDNNHTGAIIYWLTLLIVVGVLVLGFRKARESSDPANLRRWIYCLVALPVLSLGISLVSGERASTYRVISALSGVILVLVTFAVRNLLIGEKLRPKRHYPGLVLIWLIMAIIAHQNSYNLIALPQGHEWELMRNTVLRGNFNQAVRVFIITPTENDRSTDRIYGDEFGSMSSATPETAQDMFKMALHDRFHGKLPKDGSYTLLTGPAAPTADQYDLLIDMRKLREFRD